MSSTKIALRHDLGEIAQLNDWLEFLADIKGWSTPVRNDIKLCLNEAVTNIFSYGFEATPNPLTELEVVDDKDGVMARLIDNGIAFNPLDHPSRPKLTSLDDTPIGGFGIQLMRDHCPKLMYKRDADLNVLEFFWPAQPA